MSELDADYYSRCKYVEKDFGETLKLPNYKWKLAWCQGSWLMLESAPCWFHRLMQQLVFGFRYERLKEEK